MSAVVSEEELVAACRQILRQWPGARAAVLFGSRARGTAHPNSDRDVAIVLEGDKLRHPRPARSVFARSELPADLRTSKSGLCPGKTCTETPALSAPCPTPSAVTAGCSRAGGTGRIRRG